jgi:hypothetical protein
MCLLSPFCTEIAALSVSRRSGFGRSRLTGASGIDGSVGASGGNGGYLLQSQYTPDPDVDYKLEALHLMISAFKNKMRSDFDSTYLSLDRKNRTLRKELLQHMSDSLDEVESRLTANLKQAVQDYQLIELEFRKNLKSDVYAIRDELEKQRKHEDESTREVHRKLKLQESYLIELRSKFEDVLAGGVYGTGGAGGSLMSHQQLLAYQSALENLGVKVSTDITEMRKEIEGKNIDVSSQILELRKVIEQVILTEEKSFR